MKQGRVQVDGKTMTKKKSVEANALVVVELPPPSRPQTAVETFEVGDLVQVGDDRGVVTALPVKGKGPWKITVGDEPHPRKLKTGEFTKLDEPEEEEEKDLGGEEHATEWVMHEKFLADERLESWDGTTQRPVQLADPPKELLIPEHLQLKYAKESFTIGTARKDGSRRKRGPHIIQNLIFAVREADKNFERRELLAAEQEQFLDHEAIAKAERNKLKSTRDRRNVLNVDARGRDGGRMETGGYAICQVVLYFKQASALRSSIASLEGAERAESGGRVSSVWQAENLAKHAYAGAPSNDHRHDANPAVALEHVRQMRSLLRTAALRRRKDPRVTSASSHRVQTEFHAPTSRRFHVDRERRPAHARVSSRRWHHDAFVRGPSIKFCSSVSRTAPLRFRSRPVAGQQRAVRAGSTAASCGAKLASGVEPSCEVVDEETQETRTVRWPAFSSSEPPAGGGFRRAEYPRSRRRQPRGQFASLCGTESRTPRPVPNAATARGAMSRKGQHPSAPASTLPQ